MGVFKKREGGRKGGREGEREGEREGGRRGEDRERECGGEQLYHRGRDKDVISLVFD